MFTVLPALLIHPPFNSDPAITELVDAGGYTQFGGIDVRVPLDVMRNLQMYVCSDLANVDWNWRDTIREHF